METYFGKPDENNLSDDINEAVMRSVIRNIRVLLTDPGELRCPQRAGVGVRDGRKRRSEDRQGHGLPVPHARASAGRVHQLQPRCRSGGDPPRSVPPYATSPARRGLHGLRRMSGVSHPTGSIRAETGCWPVSTRWLRSSRKLGCRPALQSWASPPTPIFKRHRGFHRSHPRLLQEAEP